MNGEQWAEYIREIMLEQVAVAVYNNDDAIAYCESLVLELAAEYGMNTDTHKIEFHTGWRSHGGGYYLSQWHVTLGAESMEWFFRKGPREYARLIPMLECRGLDDVRGYRGLRILVLHEFAHAVQYFFNINVYNYTESYNDYYGPKVRAYRSIKPHGVEFKEAYAKLLDSHGEAK